MKLTALEIKQQKFEKSLRGYDPDEVQAFLSLVSNEWEHMVAKNRELQTKIEHLEEKLKHYEKVEQALHETLQTAKDSAEHKLEGARKEARNKIDKAEMEAESIVRDATQKRQQVRQEILRLLDRRKEIIGGIRSYLELAQESIDHFDRDEAELFKTPSTAREESGAENSGTNTSGKTDAPAAGAEGSTGNGKSADASGRGPKKPQSEELDDIIDELD